MVATPLLWVQPTLLASVGEEVSWMQVAVASNDTARARACGRRTLQRFVVSARRRVPR
jgi:hypothetical protein